jgi:bacterioferritin-associated ferredoxin
MIVCCCFGTTDREIRDAFGPDGSGKCPAGQGCGSCADHVRALVAEARTAEATRESTAATNVRRRR